MSDQAPVKHIHHRRKVASCRFDRNNAASAEAVVQYAPRTSESASLILRPEFRNFVTFTRDRMTVRGAPVVRRILKSTWSPSISQSKGRNLLPYFSQALSQAGARRDRSAFRSRVPATNSPFLRRYCSLHHSPLDVSASLMASSSENAADHYRLPTDARPKLYDLTIRTDLEKEKFTGFVKIECVQRLSRVFRSSCSSLHTTASKS